jgi:hypothetical protein
MKENKIHSIAAAVLISLLLLSVPAQLPGQSKVGTTAAPFLGIPIGARASAMGGASVGEINDVTALYWNPGAFVQAQKSQAMFSNTGWLFNTDFKWFGFMLNLGGSNAIGVSVTHLDYGDEEVTTVQNPDGTGEYWSAQDIAIAVSYSRRLTDRFSLGGSVKYIGQSVWNENASTFALDLGLLYVTGFNNMRLGVSMSNFGGDMQLDGRDLYQRVDIDPDNPGGNKTLVGKLKTDPWPLPLFFRVGVAMDVVRTDLIRFTVAADALRPTDNREAINVGGEIGWNDMLFVRGGYRSLFREDTEEGLTLGGGLKYSLEGFAQFEVNYAFTQFGLFGNLNTISVGVGF